MAYLKRLALGSFHSLGSIIGVRLLSIISSAIIARLLGPTNLGILSIFQNIHGVFDSISQSGSASSVVKYTAEYKVMEKTRLERFLSTTLISMFIISLSVSIIYFYLSDYISNNIYNEPMIAILIKIGAINLIFAVMINMGVGILQGMHKIKQIALLSVVNSAISIPISYILILNMGLIGAVISSVICALINLILNLNFVNKNLKSENLKLRFEIHKEYIDQIFKYSFPLFIASIIIRPARLYGQTLLAMTQDFIEVGYFKIALTIYNLMSFIPAAISVPLMPIISEIDISKREKRSEIYSKILKIILFTMLPFSIIVGLLSKYIILGIYGEKFIEASFVTQILVVSAFFGSITSFLENLMLGTGKTMQILYTNIYMASIFVISSYILIRPYGTLGLSVAWLIVDSSLLPIYLIYAKKKSYIDMSKLKIPLIFSIVFLVLSFLIQKSFNGGMLIFAVLLYIIIVILIEYSLLDIYEKNMIQRLLKVMDSYF